MNILRAAPGPSPGRRVVVSFGGQAICTPSGTTKSFHTGLLCSGPSVGARVYQRGNQPCLRQEPSQRGQECNASQSSEPESANQSTKRHGREIITANFITHKTCVIDNIEL